MTTISYLATLLALLAGTMALAQEPLSITPLENPPIAEAPAIPEPAVTLIPPSGELPSKVYRTLSRGTVMAHLSPFSTWLPMKYGFSAGYIHNENWTWEFEYTQRSISAPLLGVDLGQVVDQRYGIQSRWYPGANSFHLIMGVFKSKFSFELGNTILQHLGSVPPVTLWKFESLGPELGLGNRWQWGSGFTLGVDWFTMYVPLFNKQLDDAAFNNVTNQSDRDDLDKISKAIANIPQFDILKIHLGYSF